MLPKASVELPSSLKDVTKSTSARVPRAGRARLPQKSPRPAK